MVKFTDLPLAIIWKIGQVIVQDRREAGLDVLGLLPVQSVYQPLSQAILSWIFRTSLVKVGAVIRFPPQPSPRRWSSASDFLVHMKDAKLSSFVSYLAVKMEPSRRDVWPPGPDPIEQCIALLDATSPFIRMLHLQGQADGEPKGVLQWRDTVSKQAFDCLEILKLDSYYLPLLPPIIRQSPRLKALTIGHDPKWIYHWGREVPDFAVFDMRQPTFLTYLCVDRADDSGVLELLPTLQIQAKHIHLNIYRGEERELNNLAQGIKKWPLFRGVKTVSFTTWLSSLPVLEEALRNRNIAFMYN